MNIGGNVISRAVCVALGVVALSGTALADKPYWAQGAGHHDSDRYSQRDYADYARVVDVDPIVQRVRVSHPVRECWNEQQPVYGRSSGTVARSTLLGGLIGAAVGHHIGRDAGTHDPGVVVGSSLIGAAIGNSIGRDRAERNGEYQPVGYQNVERCQVNDREEWEERIEGYRVSYEFNGHIYTTRMPYDPGRRVRVNVDVRPSYDRRER